MCDGTGLLPDHIGKWQPYGERLKAERIHRGLTVRTAAKYLGIDASNLSKMERGLIAPQFLWKEQSIEQP